MNAETEMKPEHQIADLRQEIDGHISTGTAEAAAAGLDALWRQEPGPSSAAFIVSRIEKLRGKLNLACLRVAVLRSFTVEPAIPLLRAAAFSWRLDIEVQVGSYNAYMQEILDREGPLYQ